MKNNNLININKKLGVSTKWTFLEGFAVYGGGEIYEVYKFGETLDFGDENNPFFKEREESEEIRRMMTKTHFVIRSFTGGRKYLDKKYFINTQARNSEKYPHHTEDIIAYLRKVVNSKYVFWDLEKYFRMEEYSSYWDIFPLYFSKDYGICGGETYTPPVFKKYVENITEERVYIDHLLYSNIHFRIPEGIPGRYNFPINCTLYISCVDIIYKTLQEWDRCGKRPDDWEVKIQDLFKKLIDSRINDLKIYDERRPSRKSSFDILPHPMRREIKEYLYPLYKYYLERSEEKLAKAQKLLTCENDKDMLYNFEKQLDSSPVRKDFLTFRVENHTMNLLDYGDKEKLKKIIPGRLTHWSDEYSIYIEDPRNPGIFIGFSFHKENLVKFCDHIHKTPYEIIKDILSNKGVFYIHEVWGEELKEYFKYHLYILNPEYPQIGLSTEVEKLSTLHDKGYYFFDSSNIDEICNTLEENKVFENIKGDE
nr:MAG TPA: hypothetical protein [Caudoviricetes sp.]